MTHAIPCRVKVSPLSQDRSFSVRKYNERDPYTGFVCSLYCWDKNWKQPVGSPITPRGWYNPTEVNGYIKVKVIRYDGDKAYVCMANGAAVWVGLDCIEEVPVGVKVVT